MRTKLFIAALLCSTPLWPQAGRIDPQSTMHITFPEDSPVTVVAADWGESSASARGGAMLLDLHTSLSLRNSSSRRLRGITLLVLAQEVTPGGKASVAVPSLNVGPGENFPVRMDLRLLRPLQAGSGPLVEIRLDGVLFDDLSFFGPDRLNSRRSMTVWELEAKRDRQYFRHVLESKGRESLRSEIVASLEQQAQRAQMDARVSAGRATAGADGRQVQLAFVESPNAPVLPEQGYARIVHEEARAPRLSLRNRSDRPIDSFELGWIVRDSRGKEFVAGSIPVQVDLQPRQRRTVLQDVSFRFTQPGGQPIAIESMTAFVSSVQFAGGEMWVPERSTKLPTVSPEEQRLAELYKRKGMDALVQELKKFEARQ
jgi:hypothetical protein